MTNEPVTLEEIYAAYQDCRKRKKETTGAIKFETYELYNCQVLVDDINNRKYKLRPSECFVVKYPVAREVFCANFRDRIVQHFVYNEINPIIESKLIRDTASCRPGKGTDYAIDRAKTFLRRETKNYKEEAYIGKGDLQGFFMSLDRSILYRDMESIVINYYKGKHAEALLYLLKIIILSDVTIHTKRLCPASDWSLIPKHKSLFGNDRGLPIGNITTQMFANYSLNDFDHFMKSRHKSYIRYVDDFIIADKSKEKIEETLSMAEPILAGINQKINRKKTVISKARYGVVFLGVHIKPYAAVLSPKRINRLYYTTKYITSPEKFCASSNCRKGMFKRYHGYHVCQRWYDSRSDDLKSEVMLLKDYKFYHKKESVNKELIKM